jgi:predicted GIY-YIG superfamily endonuclease
MTFANTNIKNNYLIYKINFEKNYYYIGVSNNFKRRLTEHKYHKAHKILNYEFLEINLSEEEAYNKEKSIITDDLIKDPLCLNQTRGGRHPYNKRLNVPHSKETKEKISNTKKRQASLGLLWVQQEKNKNIIKERCLRGDDNPSRRPEVREKIRLSKLGPLNPQYGKRGTMLGKKASPETKHKQLMKLGFKIKTPVGIFIGAETAAKHYKIRSKTVLSRCRNQKFPEWQILGKGE